MNNKNSSNFKLELLLGSKLTYYDRQPNKKEKKRLKILAYGQINQQTNSEEVEKREHEERIQRLRKYNRIFTWGPNIPDPIDDFSALTSLPNQLRTNISHFTEPTPVQMQAIPLGFQHRDLLVSAPTGSGKTLAFAIPVIIHSLSLKQMQTSTLSAIVLEPTKVLAKQTYDNFVNFCAGLNLNCAYLRGEEIDKQTNILISTPNRLIYALDRLDNKQQLLVNLQWLIVDECDRIFDKMEGENSFCIQLAKILDLCNGSETRRGFFSATFSSEVEQWCKEHLQNVAMLCIGPRNSANEFVQQELLFVGWEQAKIFTVRDIIRRGFNPPALVFLQSKDRAKQLYTELSESCKNIPIGLISGDLSEEECELVIDRFRQGSVWLLIATEILGRGLDFTNVNLVINFDLPTSIVSYIHRIGRTGRAGRLGRAITLFTEADMPIIRPIATVIQQAGFPVPDYLLRLHKPTREERKKLHKSAPHRKNLVSQWSRTKYRIKSNRGIVPIKNETKNKKASKKMTTDKNGKSKIGRESETHTKDTKQSQIDSEQGWEIVGPPRSKRRRKMALKEMDTNKSK